MIDLHECSTVNCPEEIYVVMVVICGNSVLWTSFTPDKKEAEFIAKHHCKHELSSGIVVGPLRLCWGDDSQSHVTIADLIESLGDIKQESLAEEAVA